MRAALKWNMLALFTMFLVSCNGGGGSSTAPPPPGAPAPKVTNLDPAASDSSASTGATISVSFDQKMRVGNDTTFVVNGSLTGKLDRNAGTFGIDATETTLDYDPNVGLKIGEEIEVTLTAGLTSTEGESLETPVVYRFRVEVMGGSEVFDPFPIPVSPLPVGTPPQSVTAGDWDGDGDLDLAVTTAGDNVRLLLNNGSGVFSEDPLKSPVSGVVGPQSIVAGDWDGDGDLDLAVGNSGATNVSILFNDATGGFTQPLPPASPVEVGNTPRTVTAGDWDGDGDLDLAITTAGDKVRVLFNDGSGVFPAFNEVAGVVGPRSVIPGDWDMDPDRDLDLAVGNSGATNVSILSNNGTGVFTQDVLTSPVEVGNTPQGNPQSMVAGDWDGDGDLDLAVGRTDTNVTLLENTP